MRKLFVLAMAAALVGVGWTARDASAGATVDLLFIGQNGSPIAPTTTALAAPSDTLTMVLLITPDQLLGGAAISLSYDTDDMIDELDVVANYQWFGTPLGKNSKKTAVVYSPIVPLLPTTATLIGSFNGASDDPLLPTIEKGHAAGVTYQYGTVIWHVNAGDAVTISSFFNPGIDDFLNSSWAVIPQSSILLNSATVIIPEPGTASLLGLGLLGLVVAGRRRA